MKLANLLLITLLLVLGCGRGNERGIADKRTDFKKFVAMEGNPGAYGLKAVRPYFRRASRPELLGAIERACQGRQKSGSSIFNPATGAGYYVNCNPANRQLLNGYLPLDPKKRPHGERSADTP